MIAQASLKGMNQDPWKEKIASYFKRQATGTLGYDAMFAIDSPMKDVFSHPAMRTLNCIKEQKIDNGIALTFPNGASLHTLLPFENIQGRTLKDARRLIV